MLKPNKRATKCVGRGDFHFYSCTAYKSVTKAKRGMLAARASAPAECRQSLLRPTALLKRHGAELGHHAGTAHSLAVHPRARHPSCPAGARGDEALVGPTQLQGTGCCLPYIVHTSGALSGMH